jgi:hypothetical protein
MLIFKRKFKIINALFLILLIIGSFFSFFISKIEAQSGWGFIVTAPNGTSDFGFETKEICLTERAKTVEKLTKWPYITISECFEVSNIEEEIYIKPVDESKKINTDTNYTLLAPLSDGTEAGFINFESDPSKNPCPFGKYMNIIIKLFIGISAVLAMVMIIYGGIQYMTSIVPSEKGSGKDTISHAIFGLVVALGAYLILYTLNPNLLNFCLDQQLQSVNVVVDDSIPQTSINGKYCTNTAGANGGYFEGVSWETIAGGVTTLPAGVTSNYEGSECIKVGQKNCTSLRGLNLGTINTIKSKCASCTEIVITGGTECWLHGGSLQKTTHRPNSPTIDLRLETKLNEYIKSGTNNGSWYQKDGMLFLLESDHWHVGN